jgi:hypothetical protein
MYCPLLKETELPDSGDSLFEEAPAQMQVLIKVDFPCYFHFYKKKHKDEKPIK